MGKFQDEELEPSRYSHASSSKEFLSKAIYDYNQMFKTNFSTDGKEFQNYRDLSKRVKSKEVDLLDCSGNVLDGI